MHTLRIVEDQQLAALPFRSGDLLLANSPGVPRAADTEATKQVLAQLNEANRVLLVLPATPVCDDLRDPLPLVQGRSALRC